MTISHNDDLSLQAWGRNLRHVGPALEELARQADNHVETGKVATASLKKMATVSDSELPASKLLVAEVEALASESAKLDAEAEEIAKRRRTLIARGEALYITYQREHETDEDRLNNPRTSRAAERRADVGRAEQDI